MDKLAIPVLFLDAPNTDRDSHRLCLESLETCPATSFAMKIGTFIGECMEVPAVLILVISLMLCTICLF